MISYSREELGVGLADAEGSHSISIGGLLATDEPRWTGIGPDLLPPFFAQDAPDWQKHALENSQKNLA